MANRYANLVGTNRISEEYTKINEGFDKVQEDMDSKVGGDSPQLTGNPTAPTQPEGDNSTKIATTEYADRAAGVVQTNLDEHAGDTSIHVTQADHDKLNGIQEGAQVNQNAFAKIAVSGQSDIDADSPIDTLNIAGGTGITVTTNPLEGTVTITATGEATPGPHALSHITGGTDVIPNAVPNGDSGLMSGADKAALDQAVQDVGEAKESAAVAKWFAATTNSGNDYAATLDPEPGAYFAGFAARVSINADSTGASTINFNSLGPRDILKPSGQPATNLKASAVYTLVYNGTAFILQGEGGSGNAQPEQVLVGVTFTNDDGEHIGTMPDRSGDSVALDSEISGTTLRLLASEGYRDGVNDFVTITDPDFIAANIREGVNLFGLQGTLVEGKQSATGTAQVVATNSQVVRSGGGLLTSDTITVAGLGFEPSIIIAYIKSTSQGENFFTIYFKDELSSYGTFHTNLIWGPSDQDITGVVRAARTHGSTSQTYVNSSSFRIPIPPGNTGKIMTWMAIE